MPTFLTTEDGAALAARVEASVGGDKSPALVRAFLRFGIAFGLVALVVWALAKGRESGHILERERASLLDALRTATASLGDGRDALGRDEGFIERLAGSYEGDLVAPEQKGANALRAVSRVRSPTCAGRSTSFEAAPGSTRLHRPRSKTRSCSASSTRRARARRACCSRRCVWRIRIRRSSRSAPAMHTV